MPLTAREFVDRLASSLSLEPLTEEDVNALLGLAGVAAHASERTAAPLSCWLAARAGVTPQAALEAAQQIAKETPES